MIAYLYEIYNTVNDRKYYGIVWKPKKTVAQRFEQHMNGHASCGKHLYDDVKILGCECFKVRTLLIGDLDYIRNVEVIMITKYGHISTCGGYNACRTVCIVNTKDGIERMRQVSGHRCRVREQRHAKRERDWKPVHR